MRRPAQGGAISRCLAFLAWPILVARRSNVVAVAAMPESTAASTAAASSSANASSFYGCNGDNKVQNLAVMIMSA